MSHVFRENPGVISIRTIKGKNRDGLTAATFPPTLNPWLLKVSLLSTVESVGSATMVPEVSFPIIAGKS